MATAEQQLLASTVERLGGEVRPGQVQMVDAVAEAIAAQSHLLVQAGTGTGKSLGYLVPAAIHAVETGERVVVSTGTIALQRQLVTRDLPLVAVACADVLGREPSFAVLKGWRNYACRFKIDGGYPDEDASLFSLDAASGEMSADGGALEGTAVQEARSGGARRRSSSRPDGADELREGLVDQLRRVAAWVRETKTGDRDDLVPGVSDRAWNQVSVSTRECLGSKCPLLRECFPELAQAKAREADIVVTNHTMLGIAASSHPVLPEHDVLVVDEAHELAERVTSAATAELSVVAVQSAARAARRHGKVATDALDAAARNLGNLLAAAPAEYLANGLDEALSLAVGAVRDEARKLLSSLKPTSDEVNPGLKLAQAGVQQVFDIADQIASAQPGRSVLWVTRPGDGPGRPGHLESSSYSATKDGSTKLHYAPLQVAGLIGSQLLDGVTGIFTSATLTLGGSFVPTAVALGLERPIQRRLTVRPGGEPDGGGDDPTSAGNADEGDLHEVGETDDGAANQDGVPDAGDRRAEPEVREHHWQGVDVGSPFDYGSQGILYVAQGLPAPGRDPATAAQLDQMEALINAAGGRTLGLFTSWRAAEAAAEAMRERLDFPILLQGDDQTPTLVAQFLADKEACLFGTRSLWQGVDLPGDACQLVLIDRIPFPRPDEPLTAARTEAAQRNGANGFMSVSIPQAALQLAQGAGRLIRTTTDRGVVAILDPRLATARYGSYLRRSLPEFWRTTNLEVVTGALSRLREAPSEPNSYEQSGDS